MCIVKTPKIAAPSATAAADKELPVLRNPYLDGIDPLIRARQSGVSSLRIDRGSPSATSGRITRPASDPTTAPVPTASLNRTLPAYSGPAGAAIRRVAQKAAL